MKIPSMKSQPKKPTKPAASAALPAPRVVQARMAQFNSGPKIAAPPVYRPAAKKAVQPKLASPLITARTIQRAEENPYKKNYKTYTPVKSSKRASAKASPYGGGRQSKSARLQAQSGGGVRPNYTPPRDSQGNDIWDGSRSGLSWSATITAGMAGSKAGGCQVGGNLCTGAADGIDHITDFADLQSGITQYLICDGTHHFKAAYKDDAIAVYNNDDDTGNMRWACTQCNSQKSGVRGRYENQPQWFEACPGGCGYVPWGQEA